LNAIFYVVRCGCAWRLLPHEFPPWQTANHYFQLWRLDGSWEYLHQLGREFVAQQPALGLASCTEPTILASITHRLVLGAE
jgi:putative transposase